MDLASDGTPQLPQWPPVPFPSSHWSWGFSAFLGKESGLSRLYRTRASIGHQDKSLPCVCLAKDFGGNSRHVIPTL